VRAFLPYLLATGLGLILTPGLAGAQTAESRTENSPGLALGLSIGLPVAGYGLIAAAMLPSDHVQTWQKVSLASGVGLALLGPSGGHVYINRPLRGVAFTAGRLALAGLGVLALIEGMGHSDHDVPGYQPGAANTAMVQMGLCGAGILALSVWESVSTYRLAERMNRPTQRTVALGPLLAPNRDGGLLAGLTLGGHF